MRICILSGPTCRPYNPRMDKSTAPPHTTRDPDAERMAAAGVWRGGRDIRRFAVVFVTVLTVFTIAAFLVFSARTDAFVAEIALEQARSYTDLVVAARSWNSDHGAVYVEKTADVDTNPFLIELGIQADAVLADGRTITLRNPSVMTREIADELKSAGAVASVKLTSLDPVNPGNAPSEWERIALEAFEAGTEEWWEDAEEESGVREFRYARPLEVQPSCLRCHGGQGYEVGDVRGALSVTLPSELAERGIRQSRITLMGIGATVLASAWVFVYLLVTWLHRRLGDANANLEKIALTDELTDLWNRRFMLQHLASELERAGRHELGTGVLALDLDRFKRVNDTYGHAAGDEVLKVVSRVLRENVRTYDVVGRMGGEELLVIAPDVDAEQLAVLAERLRRAVESAGPIPKCGDCKVTVSVGTALVGPGSGEAVADVLARADAALYEAKAQGRNRVVASGPH